MRKANKHMNTPKTGNRYTLKFNNSEKNLELVKILRNNNQIDKLVFVDNKNNEKFYFSLPEYQKYYVRYTPTRKTVDSCYFVNFHITSKTCPPKYYFGLKIKNTIYYIMEKTILCSTNAKRDAVKIDIHHPKDQIPFEAKGILIEKYKEFYKEKIISK